MYKALPIFRTGSTLFPAGSRCGAVATLLVLLTGPARADVMVNDPLTDPGSAGLGVRGGAFSPSGWTTQNPDDTLWFTIDVALESGSVAFDVTGVGECQGGCLGDLDLFTLYQQPDGLGQPLDYTPGYRNNDQRVFVRTFQTGAGDPVNGAMKMELAGCAVGSPFYDNTCPTDCSALDGIAYCGGSASDCGWDASHTYHFELDWGGGTMTYSRDGVSLGSFGYPSTFAPQPLVVQLGSPRNGQVSGSGMPAGVTFANLLVQGTAGQPTPVCDAPPPAPDAGPAAVVPCTDGSMGALADSTVASWNVGVDQTPSDLNVEADGSGNPDGLVYLSFPRVSAPVGSAILHLHTQTSASAEGGSGQACALDPSASWDESSITWTNRPAIGTLCSGGAQHVSPDQDVTWDVTALVNSGTTRFALVSTDSNGAHFYSRESGGCGLGPHLLVTPAVGSGTSSTGATSTGTTGTTSSGPSSAASSSGSTSSSGTSSSGGPSPSGTSSATSSSGTTSGGITSGGPSLSTSGTTASGSTSSGRSAPPATNAGGSGPGSRKQQTLTSSGCATSGGDSPLLGLWLLGTLLGLRPRRPTTTPGPMSFALKSVSCGHEPDLPGSQR